jgi:D-tyrosyl-tRNA(Tyr) deacylase
MVRRVILGPGQTHVVTRPYKSAYINGTTSVHHTIKRHHKDSLEDKILDYIWFSLEVVRVVNHP